MRKIIEINSNCIPLVIDEIDTDQIIPARFLKSTTRIGFGDNLMRDWRYDNENNLIKSFPLNDSKFTGEILLAGDNFGCGSSREHAAWAIADYGFTVVLAKSFADIFKNNALNNGIIPIELPTSIVDQLEQNIMINPNTKVNVNLETRTIDIPALDFQQEIKISEYKRTCLMNGFDDIDYLLDMRAEIEKFEQQLAI